MTVKKPRWDAHRTEKFDEWVVGAEILREVKNTKIKIDFDWCHGKVCSEMLLVNMYGLPQIVTCQMIFDQRHSKIL